MFECISNDLYRIRSKSSILLFFKCYFVDRGFRSVIYYRIANWLYKRNIPYLPATITAHAISKTGAEIRPNADIGPGFLVKHPVGVVIGGGVKIGNNFTILQSATIGEKYSIDGSHAYPHIGNDVTICAGAVVLGDISIGDNCIIGANAVVTYTVPDNCIAVGIPARYKSVEHEGGFNI